MPGTHKYAPVAVPVAGGLGEFFISQASYVEVAAPATLPEGYTFEAEANGHAFTVRVPAGGVERGQRFSVPFPAGAHGYAGAAVPRASVPVGAFRDGLCDCFRHGAVHPMLWNACCCRLILIGQVLQRLKLTWLANEGSNAAQSRATFRICLSISLVYFALNYILSYHTMSSFFAYDAQGLEADSDWSVLNWWLGLGVGLFAVVLVAKARRHVRGRYGIPERRCRGYEDLCCSLWCNCCVVAQLARHTADYDTYAGLCCSETGVPQHAPALV